MVRYRFDDSEVLVYDEVNRNRIPIKVVKTLDSKGGVVEFGSAKTWATCVDAGQDGIIWIDAKGNLMN